MKPGLFHTSILCGSILLCCGNAGTGNRPTSVISATIPVQKDVKQGWKAMTNIPLNLGQQNSLHPWNFLSRNGVDRYEVRSGDMWAKDDHVRERSESASRFRMEAGKTYQLEYSIMVEPGRPNAAQWLALTQMQSTFDEGEVGHSPPLALELKGERFRVTSRYAIPRISTRADMRTTTHYTDNVDVQRGRWYKFQYIVNFDPFGAGHLVVIQDGRTVVDYHGPIGFNDARGPYVKMGLYRASASNDMAVQFTNIRFGVQIP